MLDELARIGRDLSTGGYLRDAWSAAELELREWFKGEAARLGLDTREDRNGNLWAWWGDPSREPGVVTGSHLDSVRQGGAYDGPLGVASAFAAVQALRERGVRPRRPLGVACFSDEEGARFGMPCMGSRLLTGALAPERALGLTDDAGDTLADVLTRAGRKAGDLGRDDETLAGVGTFVELHVEQGRGLAELGSPVGVASAIWPHGRWRFDFHGRADHAGTTLLADRDDPMLPFARMVLATREAAERRGIVATVGRARISPGNTNAVPDGVSAWLDARGAEERTVRDLVAELAAGSGSGAQVSEESWTPVVEFDERLRGRLAAEAGRALGRDAPVPVLPTGAGHDAGILAAAGVPSAMLFVRNPTGVSHSPAEHAERADCEAGVTTLASVLEELCR